MTQNLSSHEKQLLKLATPWNNKVLVETFLGTLTRQELLHFVTKLKTMGLKIGVDSGLRLELALDDQTSGWVNIPLDLQASYLIGCAYIELVKRDEGTTVALFGKDFKKPTSSATGVCLLIKFTPNPKEPERPFIDSYTEWFDHYFVKGHRHHVD